MSTVHRGLDVPTVVRASLAIADAEGLERLTMRRLASELDVTPMAIYHHVENKEQLLDLVADESLRALPPLDRDGPWTEELQGFFVAFHHLYLDHPALAHVMAQRRLEGPTAIEAAEGILTILLRAGLSDDAAVKAFVSLVNFTLGMSFYRLSRSRAAGDPQRPRFAGVTNDVAPTMFRLRSKMARAGLGDEYFVDGLTRLLDSYAAEAAPPARRRRTRKKA